LRTVHAAETEERSASVWAVIDKAKSRSADVKQQSEKLTQAIFE